MYGTERTQPAAPSQSALHDSIADMQGTGPDLLDRWDRLRHWFDERLSSSIDPYCKSTTDRIGTEATARTRDGELWRGVNFASQDYLSLSSHPTILAAARSALERFGVHSAGSAALMGNTVCSSELEVQLARFLGYDDCTLFPTGWAAGYGVIKALVRPTDFIVIDMLAHASLKEGARNATRNVFSIPHLSTDAVAARLERLRKAKPDVGILVVTEGLFSMDSDTPELRSLIDICQQWRATLVVDVAHDLGSIGTTGRGSMEVQDVLGQIDIVMGSFSKTFASNGGFVACNHPALKLALRATCGPLTFSNAMSPVQAAVVLTALSIVDAPEGAARRDRLLINANRLRNTLQREHFTVLGQASAITPVILGDSALSRLITRHALEGGAITNLIEYPAVSLNTCRWRLQTMADHTDGHVDRMVSIAAEARTKARIELASL